MPLIPLTHSVLVALVDCQTGQELDILYLFEFVRAKVIPTQEIEPVTQQFVRILHSVFVLFGHVEIVDEEQVPVSELGAPNSSCALVQPVVQEVLGFLRSSVVREHHRSNFELLRRMLL